MELNRAHHAVVPGASTTCRTSVSLQGWLWFFSAYAATLSAAANTSQHPLRRAQLTPAPENSHAPHWNAHLCVAAALVARAGLAAACGLPLVASPHSFAAPAVVAGRSIKEAFVVTHPHTWPGCRVGAESTAWWVAADNAGVAMHKAGNSFRVWRGWAAPHLDKCKAKCNLSVSAGLAVRPSCRCRQHAYSLDCTSLEFWQVLDSRAARCVVCKTARAGGQVEHQI